MTEGTNGQNSTPDDEFDRAIKALTDGAAGKARFRELSHAEREKLAQRQARSRPRGDRGGSRRGNGIGRRLRQAGIRLTTAVIVVGLVTGAAWYAMREFHGTASTATPAVTRSAATTPVTTPATEPVTASATQGPPADPFAGSPADSWADGAAGIVLPAAKPVGGYSTATVAAAYATVRKLLTDGELTKSVLLGGRPTAFAALLSAQQRTEFLDGLTATGTDKNGMAKNTREYLTAFAPGGTDLVGRVIKVRGQMTAASTTKFGSQVLDIHVNYLFAYALEPPGQPAKWLRLLVHRQDHYYFGYWDGSAGPLLPWVQPTFSQTPALCGVTNGYLYPDYARSKIEKGATIDPYSLTGGSTPGCNSALPT